MAKQEKTNTVKTVVRYYAFLFVVWGFYRFLFQFPEPLEELVIKPIIWLGPLAYLYKKKNLSPRDLGFNFSNFFHVVYSVLILGFVFSAAAFLVNYLKYGSLNFGANLGEAPFMASLALSFATALSEEITFRGYIFGRVESILGDEWRANFLISAGWAAIHLPITIFDWNLGLSELLIFLGLVFSFSVGATYVYARTRNIIAPILLHVLWQWPIILFR